MAIVAVMQVPRVNNTRELAQLLLAISIALILLSAVISRPPTSHAPTPLSALSMAATVSSPFVYTWNSNGTVYEASSMSLSTSPYWWVNSGAKLIVAGSVGQTVQGALPALDAWRSAYALGNPIDTDNGYHPQNIFRLMTRSTWNDVRVTMPFKIVRDNVSSSPNRNQSNGLLFMTRSTVSGETLYYAGIRVDGVAVIKKKYKGTYYTMAQKKIFDGSYAISSSAGTSQNLLPHDEWLNLRDETVTNADGSVTIRLFLQRQGQTTWTKILEARDDGISFGKTPPIIGRNYVGVRTDFMDVLFGSFRADAL